MAPTLEDLLAIPPDQVTPQHVHMLGLAPDPIVPPVAAAAPPIAKMTPPASATESAVKPMTPPASPGITMHYHEAPEPKPKEPKAEKPVELPQPSEADRTTTVTADPLNPGAEPTSRAELPNKLTPPSASGIAPMRPPIAQPTTAAALPNAVMPGPVAPTGIDTSLLSAPKRSLESFQSREAEPRNLSLNTTAGGPAILDRPGTSGEQADILARAHDEAAHPYGGPENHPGFLGKLAHVAARIGNVAGNIVAPGTMSLIPGTDLYKRRAEAQAYERQAGAQERETKAGSEKSQEALRKAQIDNLESEAAARGVKTENLVTDKEGGVTGWKDADGKLHSLEEPETPQAIKDIAKATRTKEDKEDWSVVPNAAGPNGELVQQEKTSGQTRFVPLEGAKGKAAKENDFEQYYDDFLKENKFPDTAHNRLLARERYAAAGQAPQRPNQQLMIVPQPDGTSKVIEVRPGTVVPKGAITVSGAQQEEMFNRRQTAPTTQMRNVAAQSQIAVDGMPTVLAELNAMRDKLGPVSGRWNEFMQGKAGMDNPDFAALRGDLLMLSSAVALAHARGRLPENLREEFDAAINAPKQNADNLIAVIQHIQPWMERQAHIGGVGGPAPGAGGVGGAQPAAPTAGGGVPSYKDWDAQRKKPQ
jgi:hypothetical protein